jgi:predicted  nucleic acid-binding Zn-ribbon protein
MALTANGNGGGFLQQAPNWLGFILTAGAMLITGVFAYGIMYQTVQTLQVEIDKSISDRARLWSEIAKIIEARHLIRVDLTSAIRDIENIQGFVNRLDANVGAHEKVMQAMQIQIAPIAEIKDMQEREVVERRGRSDKIDENLQGLQIQLARMNSQQENLANQLQGLVEALRQNEGLFPQSGRRAR